MTSHPPAFLNAPIVRRLPASAFTPAAIDVRVRIAESGLTLEHNGTYREVRWQALANWMEIAATKPATPKLWETYNFIVAYISEHKYSPSIEEIQQNFGLRSMSSAWKRIRALIACGLIRKNPRRNSRNLELVL